MANAEDLNAAQEAPWMATLRGGAAKLGELGQAAWNNNPFTLPTRMALAYANSPNTQDTVNRAVDYVKGTDPLAAGEAFLRLNPVTALPFMAKDALQGKLVDNLRYDAGSAVQIPSDIARSVVNLPGFVSDVSGMTGGPTLSKSVTDTLAGAGQSVSDFTTPYADAIAGREVNDTILRGSPSDMASGMRRAITGGAAPIPGSWTRPITGAVQQGITKLTGGSQLAQRATDAVGRTLEVLSPLSINPTPGVIGSNAAVSAVMAPGGEAYGESQRVKKEQEQADAIAKQGETQAVQGAVEAGVVKPSTPFGNVSSNPLTGISDNTADVLGKEIRKQNAVIAGVPSTGDKGDDLKVAGAIVGGALFLRYRRRIGEGIASAIDKVPPLSRKLGGYDPSNPLDANTQPLRVRMAQQRTDASVSMPESVNRAMREAGIDKQTADTHMDMRKEEAARRSGASLSHRIGIWKNDGQWIDSSAQSRMPWDEFNLRRSRMNPDDLMDLNKLELYREEVHTRGRISGLNQTQGNPNVHVRDYGYNFYDMPTPTLTREIHRIESTKPHVVDLADAWQNHVREGTKYSVERNSLEPREGQKFLLNNPYYIPPTNLKPGQTFFHNRDIVSNWNDASGTSVPRGVRTIEEIGDTHAAKERYINELFRRTESMATKRAFIQDMTAMAQRGSPSARALFGRRGPLGGANDRVVTWRDHYGKKQSIEFNDAVVRDAFKGLGNPSALQMIKSAAQQTTRLFQSGAVGPLSVVNPTFFPVDSALAYQSMTGASFSKPHGAALTLSDKIAQKLGSKSASGIPGDPSFMLMSAGQVPLNVGAVILDRTAKALHDSVIKGGVFSRLLSPAMTQKAADFFANWYRQTGLYEMQANGLMGPGMASNKALEYNMSGSASITGGIAKGIHSVTGVNMPGVVKDAAGVIKTPYNFVNYILHSMAAAPSVVALKMNRNLTGADAWKGSALARNLSGDPGKVGAFRNAPWEEKFALTSPFGNAIYQGFGRLAESARRNPGRLATGIFMTSVLPGSLSSLWNASAGSEYSQYEFLVRPPERRASHMYIARPGFPPEEGYEWPIEPMFRPFFWAGQGLAATLFGIFSGDIHKEENADMKAAIDEMVLHGEKSVSIEKGTRSRAVVDQTAMMPVHPVVGATVALFGGKKPDSYLDIFDRAKQVIDNKQAGFIEGTQADPTKAKLLGVTMPARVEEIMGAVGASGLQAAYNMVTGVESDLRGDPDRGVAPKSLMDAVGYQWEGWKQRAGGTTIGQLFGTHRATTPSQEASQFVVKRKMDTLESITNAYGASTDKGSERWFGTRNTGKEQPMGVPPKQAQDVETAQFAYDVKNIVERMKPFNEQKNLAYKQYGSIKADSRIPVEEKRIRMEEQAYRVIDVNRRMLQEMQRFEAILSTKYRRPISFDNYDKDKPFSQQNWKPAWAKQMQ